MDDNIRKAVKLALFFIAGIIVALVVIFSIRDTADDLEQEQPEPVSATDSASEVSDELAAPIGEVIPQVNLPTVQQVYWLPSEDHPYNVYSDDELRSMAESDPNAAVILGRRAEATREAELWYERAVVLSGSPDPLDEWLFLRQIGIDRSNGVLDVEAAKIGYEIFLILARFGVGQDGVKLHAKVLSEAGVDLAPIKQQAARRFERMTRERQTLLGATWEQQS